MAQTRERPRALLYPQKDRCRTCARGPAGPIPVLEANNPACYQQSGINPFFLSGEEPVESGDLNRWWQLPPLGRGENAGRVLGSLPLT